jgi:uncharacterized protein (DUF433 family)
MRYSPMQTEGRWNITGVRERIMQLPEFLTADDHGFIGLTDHRIGLHHIVRLYQEGYSPEMIGESFPTISLSLIHRVIAFYLDHREDVDRYVAVEEKDALARERASTGTPRLAELRQRIQDRKTSIGGVPGLQFMP